MSSKNVQDWEPVVITRKHTKAEDIKAGNFETVKKKENINSNKPGVAISQKEAHDFENIGTILKSPLDLKQAIQDARKASNLTQDQLNQKCNLKTNTVKNYENGTAVVILSEILAMEKILKVKLPHPKKAAKKKEDDVK